MILTAKQVIVKVTYSNTHVNRKSLTWTQRSNIVVLYILIYMYIYLYMNRLACWSSFLAPLVSFCRVLFHVVHAILSTRTYSSFVCGYFALSISAWLRWGFISVGGNNSTQSHQKRRRIQTIAYFQPENNPTKCSSKEIEHWSNERQSHQIHHRADIIPLQVVTNIEHWNQSKPLTFRKMKDKHFTTQHLH